MNDQLRTKNGYGDFGNLSKNYNKSRKGFPDEVIDYIFQKAGREHPFILDIGCGTGIATEQLHEKGAEVVGTDIDVEMIRQAKTDNRYCIDYKVAPAETQPSASHQFDAVTAFSAFHWFANKESLGETKRVLRPNGFFFAINKNEVGDFKKRNKEILRQFIRKELPNIKKKYNPKKVLGEDDFQSVEEKTFSVIEYFSPEEAIWYIQTMSMWNLVPEGKRVAALEKLSEHFREVMKDGRVERKLEITVVSGVYLS